MARERVMPETGKVVIPKGRESSNTVAKKLPLGGKSPGGSKVQAVTGGKKGKEPPKSAMGAKGGRAFSYSAVRKDEGSKRPRNT